MKASPASAHVASPPKLPTCGSSATSGWQEPVYQNWGIHLILLSQPNQSETGGHTRDRSQPSPQTLSGCPIVPRAPTWHWDELLSLMFPQSCFCWGLRPDPGLISDWPSQAQVCTPLATSRAPKLTTGTPCSCTRARLQSQIILEGRGQESQHPQPGFWDSIFTSPVTCVNHCCFFHWYNSLLSLAPAFLSTQECRGPWPSPYPPCRMRLLLVLERSCDSDNSNNKILKDQDLTSSSPIRLGSFLHTG